MSFALVCTLGLNFLCFGFARIDALPTTVPRKEVDDLC